MQKSYPHILVRILIIVILMIAFGLLNSNEKTVDFSIIAKKAKEIKSNGLVPEEFDDKLVYISGTLKSDEIIGDTFLVPSTYLSIFRKTEMYAWREDSRSGTGSDNRRRTFYRKHWASRPSNSSRFKSSENHHNPEKSIENNRVKVEKATIGGFHIDMTYLELPEHQNLSIGKFNTKKLNGLKVANSRYLYKGNSDYRNPEIGDVRISYEVLKSPKEDITLFGKMDKGNNQIVEYRKGKKKFYRALKGSRDEAIDALENEYNTNLWKMRGIGFAMVFLSISLLLSGTIKVLFSSFGKNYIIIRYIILFFISVILTLLIIFLANIPDWGSYLVFALFLIIITVGFRFLKHLPTNNYS